MRPGRFRRSGRFGGALALACALASGCAAGAPRVEHALMADRNPSAHGGDAAERYVVHCPDRVALEVEGRPEWGGPREVGADGRIPAPDGGRMHADGLTTAEIARAAADRLGLPSAHVRAQVVEYNSQQIYLFGEAAGGERAVPYQGPETVLDLLQRVGGVAPGAAPGDVQVVRSHVADGRSPELFRVDLPAILRDDQKTNVRLEPFDQIYIGQSRRSSVTSCLPPWLRPLCERVCGVRGRSEGR